MDGLGTSFFFFFLFFYYLGYYECYASSGLRHRIPPNVSPPTGNAGGPFNSGTVKDVGIIVPLLALVLRMNVCLPTLVYFGWSCYFNSDSTLLFKDVFL